MCGLALLVRAVLDNGLDPLPRLVKGRWWRAIFPKEECIHVYILYINMKSKIFLKQRPHED